jgi:hypothetical protein
MAYTAVTLGQLKQELAIRLYDINNVFWTSAELTQRIQDALRFWNLVTAQNLQWYQLPVSNTGSAPWYDLQTIVTVPPSPRLCALTDQDVYSRMQYFLLETQAAHAGVLTGQFTPNTLVQSAQTTRDDFLFRTSCTRTVRSVTPTPNVANVPLPETVIQVERAYYLPTAGGNPYPLARSDQFARAAYYQFAGSTPGNPLVYNEGLTSPLNIELAPPPSLPSALECLTIESQAILTASTPTLLYLPNDCIGGIAWGACGEVLDSNSEAKDASRAAYAKMRYAQFCELLQIYPLIVGARVNGIDVMVESVEALDIYNPPWRTPVAQQNLVAFAGQNLICFPTTTTQNLTLLINGNAAIPVADGDAVQLGREIIDAVLDLAQHEASFKQGGTDLSSTMPLMKNFLEVASQKNGKIRSLALYRDFMYPQNVMEKLINPPEVVEAQ